MKMRPGRSGWYAVEAMLWLDDEQPDDQALVGFPHCCAGEAVRLPDERVVGLRILPACEIERYALSTEPPNYVEALDKMAEAYDGEPELVEKADE